MMTEQAATHTTPIELYWETLDPQTGIGQMSHYNLPDGRTIERDDDGELIDLSPLTGYIGHPVHYHLDGQFRHTRNILAVERDENGVNGVVFETTGVAVDVDIDIDDDSNEPVQKLEEVVEGPPTPVSPHIAVATSLYDEVREQQAFELMSPAFVTILRRIVDLEDARYDESIRRNQLERAIETSLDRERRHVEEEAVLINLLTYLPAPKAKSQESELPESIQKYIRSLQLDEEGDDNDGQAENTYYGVIDI